MQATVNFRGLDRDEMDGQAQALVRRRVSIVRPVKTFKTLPENRLTKISNDICVLCSFLIISRAGPDH